MQDKDMHELMLSLLATSNMPKWHSEMQRESKSCKRMQVEGRT